MRKIKHSGTHPDVKRRNAFHESWRTAMPILLGVILGVFLTVAGAFAYDSVTGRVPNGLPPSAAGARPPMVNWDVVGDNWHGLRVNVRELGANLERGWKKISG
jgi:hypothetical protein